MTFDPNLLLQNAVATIQIGVDDFGMTEDSRRVLSAARSLYAGILLLFKYRIATCVDGGEKLIFDVEPAPDGSGGFDWHLTKKNKTIDVHGIQRRFSQFDIKVDWKMLERLQRERNNFEHLHPVGTVDIKPYIADVFTVLRQFITDELGTAPVTLLGEACWNAMLNVHTYLEAELKRCETAWECVDTPENLCNCIPLMRCPNCGSPLLLPAEEGPASIEEDEGHECVCVGCGTTSGTVALLEEALLDLHGGWSHDEYYLDPPVTTCPECDHGTYVVGDDECCWCGYTRSYKTCAICEESLSLDEQEFGGLCGYHYNVMSKDG